MKKLIGMLLVAVMVLGIGLLSQASAYTVMSTITSGPNQASDEDREYLIDRTLDGVGVLSIGDSLRGSININTMNTAGANLGGSTPGNELTGVFQVMVTSTTAIGPVGSQLFYVTFGPDPAFEAVYGAGAVVALYEGATHNYAGDFDDPSPATPPLPPDDGTPSTTVPPSSADVSVGPYATEEAFISLSTDGSLFAILGFLGLAGEGMDALTTTPQAALTNLTAFSVTSGSAFANSNLGLNLLALGPAGTGLVVDRVTPVAYTNWNGTLPPGLVDFALSQQLRGVADLNTPFEVSSNTNISFFVPVPEPSTLLLLGSGLLGLGALRRKRKMEK